MPHSTYKTFRPTGVIAALALISTACAVEGKSPEEITVDTPKDAAQIHRDVLTLDAHTDIWIDSTPLVYSAPDGTSAVSLEKLTEGQMDAIVLTARTDIFPKFEVEYPEARENMDLRFQAIENFINESDGNVVKVLTKEELVDAVADDKKSVIIAIQNFLAFDNDVDQVDYYFEKGARVFGIAFLGHSRFADSSRPLIWQEPEPNGGLSDLGREAVCRVNALGGVLDISQLSDKGALQMLDLSTAPVIASHSGVRALEGDGRNLSDELLDAIAKKNGVAHITAFRWYLQGVDPAEFAAKIPEIRRTIGVPPEFKGHPLVDLNDEQRSEYFTLTYAEWAEGTVSDLVDHIDYVVDRIGIDHVGIGSDFNHGAGVEGYRHAGEAQNITEELLRRGYSESDIEKIWGGNFLRVFAEAERVARSIPNNPNCQ